MKDNDDNKLMVISDSVTVAVAVAIHRDVVELMLLVVINCFRLAYCHLVGICEVEFLLSVVATPQLQDFLYR